MSRKLTSEQQIFIVQSLACMMTPSEVVEAVKDEFKLTLSRQLIWSYSPENNADLAPELKKLFADTRKAFEEETISVRVQKKAFRLTKLDTMITKAERARNLPLAALLLEQIAKEEGGQYTNRQRQDLNLSGQLTTTTMTVEDFKRQEAKRVRQAELSMADFEEEDLAAPQTAPNQISTIELIPVQSSNVASIGYDEASKTVAVLFHSGGLYHVSPVEQLLFDEFLIASSKGCFYNKHFKNVEGINVTMIAPAGDASA